MKTKLKKAAAAILTAILCGCAGGQETEKTPENTAAQSGVEEVKIPEAEPFNVTCRVVTADSGNTYDVGSLYSEGVYMVNLDSDTVVVKKNPDKQLVPASLTKIMTAVVCLENISDLSGELICDESCFDEFSGSDPNFEGASGAAIEPGQEGLTYFDCLYGLMLPSGCEAANIIAYNVTGGDIPAFVKMMNETAVRIGCKNTNFTNPHGLYEEENYSSARDMYIITRYAMDNFPIFTEISCAVEYQMPANPSNPEGYTVTHTNRMGNPTSEYYYEGVKGVKTGSINEYFNYDPGTGEWVKAEVRGVRGLVAICSKDGYSYLLSTVAAPFYNEDGSVPKTQFPFLDQTALFDWAFGEFGFRRVISAGDVIASLAVENGTSNSVNVIAGGDFSAFMQNSLETDDALRFVYPLVKKPLNAPIEKGAELGTLVIEVNGEKKASIPLIAENAVSAKNAEAA